MDVTPRRGVQFWSQLFPLEIECQDCWGVSGSDHRVDSVALKKARRLGRPETSLDIIGECLSCMGTGIMPVPLSEIGIQVDEITGTWRTK